MGAVEALLDADISDDMLFKENFTQQSTTFQAVRGIDRISTAFAEKPGPVVQLGESHRRPRTDTGASVVCVEKRAGKRNELDATIASSRSRHAALI
jgi:monoamine oxidase